MEFPSRLTRLRAGRKPDPMNPRRSLPDWEAAERLEVAGFLDASESSEVSSALRQELVSSVTLYLPGVGADVRRGDRVTDGTRTWSVTGEPDVPLSPFTGWQPYMVLTLEEVRG